MIRLDGPRTKVRSRASEHQALGVICSPHDLPVARAALEARFGIEPVVLEHLPASDPGADVLVAHASCFGEPGVAVPGWVLDVGGVYVLDEDGDPLREPLPRWGRAVKRLIDVVGAAGGLILFSLPLIVGAVVVLVDSGRPVLHRGRRIGRSGERFDALKLRTMIHDNDVTAHQSYVTALMQGRADKHDGIYRLADDTRITRSGSVLRKYAIDELPQLWNVLCGDMSLVGPRPPMDREAMLYDARAWSRLRVKPGITGLWQVEAHGEVGFQEMVEFDIEYWRQWSLRLDVSILLRTPGVVLRSRGFR